MRAPSTAEIQSLTSVQQGSKGSCYLQWDGGHNSYYVACISK